MARVCVFDVNETLLALGGLDASFATSFGDTTSRREWFAQVIQSALVATLTDAYATFTEISTAALRMTAARRDVELTDDEIERMLSGMRQLSAYPDVKDCLERLRAAGVRLATLTNATLDSSEAALTHAGIRPYFEQVLSADSVRRLKPAPEPYRMAAERLGVAIGEIRLVAAHAWDIAGAMRAGCAGAFVARHGTVYDPLAPVPDVVGPDLHEVTRQILVAEGLAQGH